MGADFIEQDVVLTRDAVPVILHDVYLDSTTDVAARFPDRARADGHFYAMDFSLTEIRALRVHERRRAGGAAVFPNRFPAEHGFFGVPTLAEEIALIAGLDRSRGRRTGLYTELKSPRRHRESGLDIVSAVLDVLRESGYDSLPQQVFLQCFDDDTLRQLRDEHRIALPLIQLIADNSWGEDCAADYDYLRTDAGLDYIASYADGIGPWLSHIYSGRDETGAPRLDSLVGRARHRGLVVHPYTFRRDDLPPGFDNFAELLDLFIGHLQVDGLFTDFPDLVVEYLREAGLSP